MRDDLRNDDEHVSPDLVEGAHDSEGTMGRTAGTGAGAISGGVVGMAVGGPIGAVVGAVAGAVLGNAGGAAAHDIGDDHDDVNVRTHSDGELGKTTGAGAGAISGAVVGTAVGGPVGTVIGAVGGGMLGAAAGDSAKDMGGDDRDAYDTNVAGSRVAAAGSVETLTHRNENVGIHTGDAHDTVRLHEERLDAHTQTVKAGEVSVRKEIVAEQRTLEVPVTREEVVIERHPVSGVEATNFGQATEEIRIPISEERVTVSKTPVVTEEISVGKRTVEGTQTVSDTVRREEARIEQTGNVRVAGGNTRDGDVLPGNDVPGVQTGGQTTAGADTRGMMEKTADVLTGDKTDDKTGGRVLND